MDLIVRDDGIGMDGNRLERLRKKLTLAESAAAGADGTEPEYEAGRLGSGVGVRNVDERIKLYFGPGYGLEFESREDEGTTVFIHLPAIERERE
jgi:two-component system sensor histidine kinase YesM